MMRTVSFWFQNATRNNSQRTVDEFLTSWGSSSDLFDVYRSRSMRRTLAAKISDEWRSWSRYTEQFRVIDQLSTRILASRIDKDAALVFFGGKKEHYATDRNSESSLREQHSYTPEYSQLVGKLAFCQYDFSFCYDRSEKKTRRGLIIRH